MITSEMSRKKDPGHASDLQSHGDVAFFAFYLTWSYGTVFIVDILRG
jgi:hypothetical protein